MKCGEPCSKEAVWKKPMPSPLGSFYFCDEHKMLASNYGNNNDRVIRIKESKSGVCGNTSGKGMISREEFLKVYTSLPDETKGLIILDSKIYGPCSWSVIKLEVKANTKLGKSMLRKLSRLKNWRFKK